MTPSEGQDVQTVLTVTPAAMKAFAELSGDFNPIHLDSAYAVAHGFKDCVVYGGLLVAGISRLIGMQLPGPGTVWHHVKLQFKNPLFVNEEAKIYARVTALQDALHVVQLDIRVMRGTDVIAQGSVQAGFKP